MKATKSLLFGVILQASLMMGGCAVSPPSTFGHYVQSVPPGFNDRAVADTLALLSSRYPSGRTRFNAEHPTGDAFGAALLDGLRSKGYALKEFNAAQESVPPEEQVSTGISLRYIVDATANTPSIYRVTVLVGNSTFSRAYVHQNSVTVPAGAWTLKE